MIDLKIQLPDGRNLGYAEYGSPSGKPLLFFHGQPGNRLFRHPKDEIAENLGVRIIRIDCPGYGNSDFQPSRKIIDWPDDIVFFCDRLGINKFAVLGFSIRQQTFANTDLSIKLKYPGGKPPT